jgi:putative ABC transport system permease protein
VTRLRTFVSRLWALLRARQMDRDVDDEIASHLAEAKDEYIRQGLSPEDAHLAALRSFGGVTQARQIHRQVRSFAWLDDFRQDLRFTIRALRRSPGFAAVAILTLALGIGMTTAVFSVFNAVVLRPVAYPNPERLVWLATVGSDAEPGFVSAPDFVDWREQAESFDGMAAYGSGDGTLSSVEGATRVRYDTVTEDFWRLTGAQPSFGRLPRPGERGVALLSDGFARRWFSSGQQVVGRSVTIDGRPVTIIGVLPRDFRFHFPRPAFTGFRPDVDVYRPLFASSARSGPVQLLDVVARLRAGVTLERARAEMETVRARIAQAHPSPFNNRRRLRLVPLQEQLMGGARLALVVMLVAVVFVLLIACGNAANLLLARASVRHREIAIRVAIGAGRGRVLKQLFVETLALAASGAAAGLVIARLGIEMILQINPQAAPRLAETNIDIRVLGVVLSVSVLSALIFGLAPALALWSVDPNHALKDRARNVSAGVGHVRVRRLLVGAELALALVLLIGAGLMLKSVWHMSAYPPGFEPGQVLSMELELSGQEYSQTQRRIAFVDALLTAVRAEAGVEAASISTHGSFQTRTQFLMTDGERPPSPEEFVARSPITINVTSEALPRVMGLQIVRGRWMNDDERAVVINESLARRDFNGSDPLGRRIRLIGPHMPVLTIVGIVADLRYSKLDALPEAEVYVPYRTGDPFGVFGFFALIRTTGEPLAVAPRIRKLVSEIDKTQVPDTVMTLEQALAESIAPRRLNLFLLGAFAIAALVLAVIGTYGVMAYSVTQRVHEIGIRIALGARRAEVIRMIVNQGISVTLAAVIVGLLGALALSSLMEGLLYGVQPRDPLTFAIAAVALAATAVVACWAPALKAAQADPTSALRYE